MEGVLVVDEMNEKDEKQRELSESERQAWHDKWDVPSRNPEFYGLTPSDVARMLLRSRKPLPDK